MKYYGVKDNLYYNRAIYLTITEARPQEFMPAHLAVAFFEGTVFLVTLFKPPEATLFFLASFITWCIFLDFSMLTFLALSRC